MRRGSMIGPAVLLGSLVCLHGCARVRDGETDRPEGADSVAAAQQKARDVLKKF